MTRFVVAVGTLTVCVVAAMAVGPLALLAVFLVPPPRVVRCHQTDAHGRRRGAARGVTRWLAGGLAALADAIAIPLIEGGELSQTWP